MENLSKHGIFWESEFLACTWEFLLGLAMVPVDVGLVEECGEVGAVTIGGRKICLPMDAFMASLLKVGDTEFFGNLDNLRSL